MSAVTHAISPNGAAAVTSANPTVTVSWRESMLDGEDLVGVKTRSGWR